MKKQLTKLLVIFLVLVHINPGFSQKQVDHIYTYYKLDAYNLTIQKIKSLKAKHQYRNDVQLILADCYWQIGEEEQSAELYQEIANHVAIPSAFQEKYATAIKWGSSPPLLAVEAKESNPNVSEKVEAALEENKMPDISSTKETENPKIIAVVNKEIPAPIEKTETKVVPVFTSPEPSSFKSVSSSLSARRAKTKPSGAYRIRVGASTDLKEFNLSKIEALGSVEVREWANKKIVFTGYYESMELAQEYIDLYLKEDYKHAVVVMMKDGRYRRVDTMGK